MDRYGYPHGHNSPSRKPLRFMSEAEHASNHRLLRLAEAIEENNEEEVDRLLIIDKTLVNALVHFEVADHIETCKHQAPPLAMAAALDKPRMLEILFKHNADAYRELPVVGGTALHLAAQFASPACVELILQKTTHIDRRNKKGWTPFQKAALAGRLENMKLLWDRGAKTQIHDKNSQSNQALHLAAIGDQPDTVEWLLNIGSVIDQPGKYEMTPLHMACQYGSADAVDVLLARRADVHKIDRFENTPLFIACRYAEYEIYKMLVSCGALHSFHSTLKSTCYHQVVISKKAFSDKHKCILKSLVDYGININQPNIDGESPLLLACLRQKSEVAQYLMNLGANVNFSAPPKNLTALLAACSKAKHEIVEFLVNKKADITRQNNFGLTALAIACQFGHLHNVQILIREDASVTTKDREQKTPLQIAAFHQHTDIMMELLATKTYYPQNPVQTDAFTENKKGTVLIESTLQESLEKEKYTRLEILEKIMFWALTNDCLDLAWNCIGKNKDLLEWKQQGATWLHLAAKYERHECISQLLLDVDVWAENDDGVTALHLTASNTAPKTARVLLNMIESQTTESTKRAWKKVLAITKWDHRGVSPLTAAIQNKNIEVLKVFWSEIKHLKTIDENFMKTEPTQAMELLEVLAQYEKPGHEDTLRRLLEHWFGQDAIGSDRPRTTLEWAVYGSQPVVVWWLLAKGGFSSNEHVQNAQSLARKNNSEKGRIIQRLLDDPPPSLSRIANPNHDRVTAAPFTRDAQNLSLGLKGSIVDLYVNNDLVNVRYSDPTIQRFIYDTGPDDIMKKAGDLHDLKLDQLKKDLQKLEPQFVPGGVFASNTPSSQTSKSESIYDNSQHNPKRHVPAESTLQLRWIHLPANDLQLMRDLVCRLSHDSKRSEMDHSLLMRYFNQSWTELAAGAGQSYMKPQCLHQNFASINPSKKGLARGQETGARNACMALYMPYLTVGRVTKQENDTKQKDGFKGTDGLDESIMSRNSRQVKHMPLSLDQYYYPILSDTADRDNDQVLSKFLATQKDIEMASRVNTLQESNQTAINSIASQNDHHRENASKEILMVNQLWIWIIDNKTIITTTADVEGQTEDQAPHRSLPRIVLERIIDRANKSRFERPDSVHSIVEMILGTATGYFVQKFISASSREFKGPCDIFRESIRRVADQESSLFQIFLQQLDDMDQEKKQQGKSRISHEINEIPQNPYHVISDETRLSYQIRDILDELHMLKSIAEEQSVVWRQFFKLSRRRNLFQYHPSYTPDEVKKEIDEMLLEAETAKGSINTLLDLRQKQASIKEAEFSREQANHTAKQSNSLFIFTVITIVFLPLSFLTSLFALDVSSFPHEGGSLKYQSWWLFPILLGVSAAVSGPCITLAWKANDISKRLHAKKVDVVAQGSGSPNKEGDSINRKFVRTQLGNIRRRFQRDRHVLPHHTHTEDKF